MNVIIDAIHFDLTDSLKNYVHSEIQKFEKFSSHLDTDIEFKLKIDNHKHIAECNVHMKDHPIVAEASSDNMYQSINECTKEAVRQIRKQKEIITKHHVKNPPKRAVP